QSILHLEYPLAINLQPQQAEFSQLDFGLTVLVFKQGDDPIDAINRMMSFLSAVVTSRYPTTNNHLRFSFDELRKLKWKALVDNVVTSYTIALKMLKIDMEPLAFRLLNNKTVHFDYLRLTQEQAAILKEVVKQRKSQNPLNNSLYHACKYTKRIQELLILIRQTCPSINNSSDKLVVVTPKNIDKRVRFTEPI
nr:hypothetical protein [Tanacetum cinerariifolium]